MSRNECKCQLEIWDVCFVYLCISLSVRVYWLFVLYLCCETETALTSVWLLLLIRCESAFHFLAEWHSPILYTQRSLDLNRRGSKWFECHQTESDHIQVVFFLYILLVRIEFRFDADICCLFKCLWFLLSMLYWIGKYKQNHSFNRMINRWALDLAANWNC